MGPTGYAPTILFKSLILQNLYGLSDPMLEEMLYDRMSFRRFCGLPLTQISLTKQQFVAFEAP
tara:strand:- start:562 stop:750 length:189 start_codon:yes stop_codon:yes gene_type:complete